MAKLTATSEEVLAAAKKWIRFVNASPTPFHAVSNVSTQLAAAGFTRLDERSEWSIQAGGKYFVSRNQSSLIAFCIGSKFTPSQNSGFQVIATHTDSPVLKLKKASDVRRAGYQTVSVEVYGGVLLHTWWDRDLGVAGRVIVRKEGEDGLSSALQKHLVCIDEPIARLSSLAIHLNREVNSDGFKFNAETHLHPVLHTLAEDLNRPIGSPLEGITQNHPPALMALLAAKIGCDAKEIVDFDLSLFDTQAAALGGLLKEFVFTARIDNLLSTFCAVEALTGSLPSVADSDGVRLVAMFDHEECGSQSSHGADSQMLPDTMERIVESLVGAAPAAPATPAAQAGVKSGLQSVRQQAFAKSLVLSVDCAHAVHPNYAEKHHELLRPMINKGVVIKVNNNQRYATNDLGVAAVVECAQRATQGSVALQLVQVKNDSPCGTTVGPILSSRLGVRTVDIGCPQLSMHSIREMCGTVDIVHMERLMQSFIDHYPTVDKLLSSE
eukprot:ANDGO_00103.mRNA.1 Aspartyl aminopeptidase